MWYIHRLYDDLQYLYYDPSNWPIAETRVFYVYVVLLFFIFRSITQGRMDITVPQRHEIETHSQNNAMSKMVFSW